MSENLNKAKDYRTKKFSDIKYRVDLLNTSPEMAFEVNNVKDRVLAQRHARRLQNEGKLKFPIRTAAIKTKTGKPTGKFSVFAVPS